MQAVSISGAPTVAGASAGVADLSRYEINVASAEDDYLLYRSAWNFTRRHYRDRLDCSLAEGYPAIAVLTNLVGEIVAVAGFRAAADGPLFLEQYLDGPIETVVAAASGDSTRDRIVELGAFTALDRAHALELMRRLPLFLQQRGFEHLVCTANRAIRLCLRLQGIHAQVIGSASHARIADGDTSWGRYYAHDPKVLLGSIQAAVEGQQATVLKDAS